MKSKSTTLLPLIFCTLFTACQPKNNTVHNNPPVLQTLDAHEYSQPLPIDSANKMLKSYLASTAGNDSSLHSLIFDADTLVRYLTDTTHGKISKVKLMFAHTLDYVNRGNFGKNAGYNNNALTLVVVGYDTNGNYVYNAKSMVYDYCQPCPYNCPSGTAAADTLTPMPVN